MEKFSHDDKENLSRKISKIKSKKHFENILKIIKLDKNIGRITGNTNGIFIMFHKLSDTTYYKIERYICTIKKKSSSECSEGSDLFYSDSFSNNDYGETISGVEKINYDEMKLSNKEKNIIKRRMYNDALVKMNNNA
jgi:hypothetical protein